MIYIYVEQIEKVVCIKSNMLNVNCNKTILYYYNNNNIIIIIIIITITV